MNSMSYSLPKYYFQDIHPDVMKEIMHGMQEALSEPSLEDLDNWLNSNISSTECLRVASTHPFKVRILQLQS
jgi:hypothetical protein